MKALKLFYKGFRHGMENFGKNVAIIVNSILLTIIYLVGVGITSILAKIINKHFLDLKLTKQKTYWLDYGSRKKSIDDHYRQF